MTQEALNKSKILDLTPLETKAHQFVFRARNKSKDIGPEIRFQPKNNVERILDYINYNGLAQLQVFALAGLLIPILPKVFHNIVNSTKSHKKCSKTR